MITVRAFPNWLQSLAAVFARKAASESTPVIVNRAPRSTPRLMVVAIEVDGAHQTTLLRLHGVLNHRTYRDLIAAATAAHEQGARHLLIDLHDLNELELSGLFALHSIARLYAGASLLDPECGWRGLRAAAEDLPREIGRFMTLIHPSPAAQLALSGASFCRALKLCPDVTAALAQLHADQSTSIG
jgi:hypothetical protein